MISRIMMVCTGNICRSPMAEVMLATALGKHNIEASVMSAGLAALDGHGADPIACELMAERGIDLGQHRAQQITVPLINEMELILVMEAGQKFAIEKMAPSARGKVFGIGKWGDFDVPDPYRQPRFAFEEALTLIDKGLAQWQEKTWKI